MLKVVHGSNLWHRNGERGREVRRVYQDIHLVVFEPPPQPEVFTQQPAELRKGPAKQSYHRESLTRGERPRGVIAAIEKHLVSTGKQFIREASHIDL